VRLIFSSTSALRYSILIALAIITPITFTGCGSSAFSNPPTTKVPPATALAETSSTTLLTTTSTVPVLLFNGIGTSSTDVAAVEAILNKVGLRYTTANSSQMDGMSEAKLRTFKLLIVPGGNSITIGDNLSRTATTNIHNAVQAGLHYLGICAGAFFGGYSEYNGLNLTSGVWFNLYSYNTAKQVVDVRFPNGTVLDIYEQDGPELSGWGSIVGKYAADGRPAIVEGRSGYGWVILSGVHPEAPASWRYGMDFTTPLSTDLALAGSLVTHALYGTALPHF
jgi:biotin protein ligase-like protein